LLNDTGAYFRKCGELRGQCETSRATANNQYIDRFGQFPRRTLLGCA